MTAIVGPNGSGKSTLLKGITGFLRPMEGSIDRGGLQAHQIAYLPRAFDDVSRAALARRFPDAITVNDEDAAVLGLNSYSDGHRVVIAERATDFARQLRERGFEPHGVDLSELLLGGGGVKCCTLELRR